MPELTQPIRHSHLCGSSCLVKRKESPYTWKQEENTMNITVYLGANEGNDPSLRKAVRELGTWIGESGNRLVYGGSKSGLMGEIAESVLQAGGEVTGVEPQFFIDMEYQYDAITELIVTKDMTERKMKMIELGEVFIAFPDRKSTRLNSSHITRSRMPSSA